MFEFRKLWGLFFDIVHDPKSYDFDLCMFMCARFQFIFHLYGWIFLKYGNFIITKLACCFQYRLVTFCPEKGFLMWLYIRMHIENKGYGKYLLYFLIIMIIHKIFTISNYYLIKNCKNYMHVIFKDTFDSIFWKGC